MLRGLRIAVALSVCSPFVAFSQHVMTAEDYAHAERWMSYNMTGLVQHTVSGVQFLPDGRVFYRDPGKDGTVYMLADPAHGTSAPAFENEKLAAALRDASKRAFDGKYLSLGRYTPDASGFTIVTGAGQFHCDMTASHCEAVPESNARPTQPATGRSTVKPGEPTAPAAVAPVRARGGRTKAPFDASPDKKHAVFIRDYNLWVRVNATGEEKQLTTDGVKDYGYATDNAGWTHSDAPIVLWSPDSKIVATFQQDQRKTGSMYLVPVTNRHPVLEEWKYPLVGDKDVTMIERVVIDVETGKMTRLKMPPDQHRSSECDDISCRGGSGWDDVDWAPDAKHVAFISTSRDHKDEWLRVADVATGDVRDVYHEHVDTYYGWQSKTNWKYLPGSNEFLWVSERSNWAQIYLYDLATGKLKNQITHGDGPIADIVHVDEKNRVIYFAAVGKEKGEDPYFNNYYRVDFDGKNQKLLTPEVADHAVTPSPDGSTFVDVYSTVEMPATAVVRDNTGKVLATLAKQDASALMAAGWKPPVPITVKARDGKTPLYGFVWKPTTFDAAKKYPVVDYVYPGPQGSGCPGRSFSPSVRDNQALAELGFIVVCIDGMGNPGRTKAFHDAHASKPEEMGDDTIPDQVSGIKELAAKWSWIDADRVGIWGHSGGGNATVSAMFHFPDFFKVGIAESGNHDNRDYEDDWDERWAGLEKIGADGKSNYDAHANQNYAANLKGKLLLAHGSMDDNVPPNNTLLVVDALIKANKDFDLIIFPNAHHGYAEASQYMMRRRWDYFVKNLAGGVPPAQYQMKSFEETQRMIFAGGGPSDDEADGLDF